MVELLLALASEDPLLVEPVGATIQGSSSSDFSVQSLARVGKTTYIQSLLAPTATETGCWVRADARLLAELRRTVVQEVGAVPLTT